MNQSKEISELENQFTREIGSAITREISRRSGNSGFARLTAYDRDYWSVILVYEITGEHSDMNAYKIYCKIPKANWNISTVDEILRGDYESSKEMAETEFHSLNCLRAGFERCPDSSLRVINPLGFLPEYNAVFTEGVNNSTEIFELLRPGGTRIISIVKHYNICGRSGNGLDISTPSGAITVRTVSNGRALFQINCSK